MRELIIFRSQTDGFLYYTLDGKVEPLELYQDNIFKLPQGNYSLSNQTGYKITPLNTTDGIPTYKLENPQIVTAVGGGRGRSLATSSGGTTFTPVYGQAYSKTPQSLNLGDAVTWDAIQNGSGVTLGNPQDIQVSTAGTYQIDWIVEINTIHSPA